MKKIDRNGYKVLLQNRVKNDWKGYTLPGGHVEAGESFVDAASEYAKSVGYTTIFILSGEIGLYEKYGFEKIGDEETTYGAVDQLFQKRLI